MVTALTNGAAGIVPAVLIWYMRFNPGVRESDVVDFLLAAAAVGSAKERFDWRRSRLPRRSRIGLFDGAAGLCEVSAVQNKLSTQRKG